MKDLGNRNFISAPNYLCSLAMPPSDVAQHQSILEPTLTRLHQVSLWAAVSRENKSFEKFVIIFQEGHGANTLVSLALPGSLHEPIRRMFGIQAMGVFSEGVVSTEGLPLLNQVLWQGQAIATTGTWPSCAISGLPQNGYHGPGR